MRLAGIFTSMWGRVFAVLLLGMVGATVLTGWLAFGERQKTISEFRTSHSLERAEQLVLALDALPAANRAAFLETAPRLGMRVSTETLNGTGSAPRSDYAVALSERLGKTFRIQSLPWDPLACPHLPREVRHACEGLAITLHDGSVLKLSVYPPRGPLPPPRADFMWLLILFLCIIAVLAYLIARMTMRPLQSLAQAATELGQDLNRPALPERGSSEIVQATRAFNAMQERLRQHFAQKTQMLAAITHDLQTPLTRLRLRLEKVGDDELREKLVADLSAMQTMVREGLELARSIDSSEALRPLDLDSLLDSVYADASDAGQDVQLQGQSGATVMARTQALRRCLDNLVGNAVKYGGYARISVAPDDAGIAIRIRDGGKGIPEQQMERVFEPFYRLESSRSRDSGGTGLGLCIAQNIAHQHGGKLRLRNLSEGGLEACLTLPLAARA